MVAIVAAFATVSLFSGAVAPAATADTGRGADAPPPAGADLTPVVSRIAGADRYELAAEISKRVSPGPSRVVYIASGTNFPDALSAGPAAAVNVAPLLLVAPDSVPAPVAASLTRLDPVVVKVIGGTTAVSDGVMATVRSIVPRAFVTRISGPDRYAVSRAVVADAFPSGASGAIVATGRDFPDALSAGAIGAAVSIPVLLVDGNAPFADGPTVTLLRDLNSFIVTIVGGTASVSTGIQNTILPGGGVLRLGGADRYAVSLKVVETSGADYATVYLATGANFPDALSGGVLAGKTNSPLFIVPPDCVPRGVLALLSTNGTKNVVLLGGTASLTAAVASLTPCSF
jgi:putative cell wall-binding protein